MKMRKLRISSFLHKVPAMTFALVVYGALLQSFLSPAFAASGAQHWVGDFQASCQGAGPGGEKGQWKWDLSFTNQDVDGAPDLESLSVDESTATASHIWLFTFDKIGKGPQESGENGTGMCNKTLMQSETKNLGLQGLIDSYGYQNCGSVPQYQSHWKATLEADLSGTLKVLALNYQGYGGDYQFSCALTEASR